MGFQVGRLREGLATDITLERSQTAVGIGVTLQLGRCDEAFAALLALVAKATAYVHTTTAIPTTAENATASNRYATIVT